MSNQTALQFDLERITMEFRVMMVCLAIINFILAIFFEASFSIARSFHSDFTF